MNIPKLLSVNARKFPAGEALITADCRLSWSELHDQSLRLAAYLHEQYQISAGDRVALYMPNSYSWVLGYFAVINLGAIVVPVNARLTSAELEYILDDCDARLVIAQGEHADRASALSTCLRLDQPAAQVAEMHARWLVADMDSEQPCTLLYTSGTTGKPKGVLFNHHALLTVANSSALEMNMRPHSRMLHMMPLTHSAPLNVFLLGGTHVGAAHVVLPEFHPTLLLDTVEKERTTHFFGAPVAFMMTAQQPDIAERDISSMQYWIYGGGPMSTEQLDILADRMQTDRLYCVYGLTEAGPSGTIMLPEEHASKAGSIGRRGALHTEMRMVDKDGNEVIGEGTGQIQIRTEGMMLGYWNKPDATAECLHSDGWLDSGDLARRDADGYYWVLGRAKELIISGGVNVYPREIEVALEAHPNVVEVAVFGVPHPQWGETVKAVVVVREPVADLHAELSAYLEPLLADYKRPRLYAEMDMLPRNANGKVMKHQLS
jgi:long-chain acyl-CoA synthetase/feruloyl-CoA synthase